MLALDLQTIFRRGKANLFDGETPVVVECAKAASGDNVFLESFRSHFIVTRERRGVRVYFSTPDHPIRHRLFVESSVAHTPLFRPQSS